MTRPTSTSAATGSGAAGTLAEPSRNDSGIVHERPRGSATAGDRATGAAPAPGRFFSFGGGQQSTAALVLAAEGRIDYRTFLFANVGDDSERAATLAYVEQYAKPYAAEHGLELIELRRIMLRGPDKGHERTLLSHLKNSPSSIDIPVRMANGSPGNRSCTGQWKIEVVARETKRRGATKDNPAIVGIGISVDEIERAKDSTINWQITEHPLLDLRLRRTDCQRIIRGAGLPTPPPSQRAGSAR